MFDNLGFFKYFFWGGGGNVIFFYIFMNYERKRYVYNVLFFVRYIKIIMEGFEG